MGSERLAWQLVANGSCTSLAPPCSQAGRALLTRHSHLPPPTPFAQVMIPAEHWHSLLLNGEELYADGEEGAPMMAQ